MQWKPSYTLGRYANTVTLESNLALFGKAGDVRIPYSLEIPCLGLYPRETLEHECQETCSQQYHL